MITWDTALTMCQDTSADTSAASLVMFKRYLNIYYKKILTTFGRSYIENTLTATTVANQQYYMLPQDFLFLKSVTLTNGNTVFPIVEAESQERWDYLNINSQVTTSVPQFFFIKPRFGVAGSQIGIWPTPSSSSYTLTIVYEKSDKDMTQTAYTTGTVAVTTSSQTITGTGTSWTAAMVGRYFAVTQADSSGDGFYYRVTAFNSSTSLTLEQSYEGVTGNSLNYQICEIFALPEEMQIMPVYGALYLYFLAKKQDQRAQQYLTLYTTDMLAAKINYAKKSRNNMIRTGHRPWFGRPYPINFPSAGIAS